jgi:hypothetical protein
VIRKKIGMLLVAAAIALSIPLTGTTPAYASVGCYASTCNGKDPQGMGCYADAYTGSQVTAADGRVLQIRYSPACGAAWGRLLSSYVGDYVSVQSVTGTIHDAYVSGTSTWTPMVDDHGTLTARAYHATLCDCPDAWTAWY